MAAYQIKTTSTAEVGVIKDVDKKSRRVTGYFSTFTSEPDAHGDIIAPTAFNKTLAERGPDSGKSRIKHLYQHQPWSPVAVPSVLKVDSRGLYFESEIAKTTLGNDLLELYDAGVITEHSIGFDTIVAERDENTGIRTLKEIRLWEGSSVTWGANEDTPFLGLKSLSEQNPNFAQNYLKNLKSLLRGQVTDELAEQVELWIKQVDSFIEFSAGAPPAGRVQTPEQKGEPATLEKEATSKLDDIITKLTISEFQRKIEGKL